MFRIKGTWKSINDSISKGTISFHFKEDESIEFSIKYTGDYRKNQEVVTEIKKHCYFLVNPTLYFYIPYEEGTISCNINLGTGEGVYTATNPNDSGTIKINLY